MSRCSAGCSGLFFPKFFFSRCITCIYKFLRFFIVADLHLLSWRAKPGGVFVSSSDSQKSSGATSEPEDLIAPGTPIQFDIMLPATEFQDQNRAGGRCVCARFENWLLCQW